MISRDELTLSVCKCKISLLIARYASNNFTLKRRYGRKDGRHEWKKTTKIKLSGAKRENLVGRAR